MRQLVDCVRDASHSLHAHIRVSAAIAAGAAVVAAAPAALAGPPEPLPAVAEHLVALEPVDPLPADSVQALLALVQPRIASMSARLQCVPYARAQSKVDLRGDASTWWAQAEGRYVRARMPSEGAVLVLRGYATDRRGHVAVVRRILSARKIVIDHANWLNKGEITVDIPVEDVSPAGDWSEVRVWNVATRAWGGRVYIARGFILPEAPSLAAAARDVPLS